MKALYILFFTLASVSLFAQESTEVEITDVMFSDSWFSDLAKAKANPDKVVYLDLSLQKHKTFPMEILTFKNLERLLVPYNYWESIPNEISKLTKLKAIDMSGNYYLNHLPIEGLKKLPNLRELTIKDNKLAKGEVEKVKTALPKCKVVTE